MIPIVNEIQVCGGSLFTDLESACRDYLKCLEEGTDREKLNFSILLPSGTKHITIRQEYTRVVAYGDFAELPDALEYAMEVGNEL